MKSLSENVQFFSARGTLRSSSLCTEGSSQTSGSGVHVSLRPEAATTGQALRLDGDMVEAPKYNWEIDRAFQNNSSVVSAIFEAFWIAGADGDLVVNELFRQAREALPNQVNFGVWSVALDREVDSRLKDSLVHDLFVQIDLAIWCEDFCGNNARPNISPKMSY